MDNAQIKATASVATERPPQCIYCGTPINGEIDICPVCGLELKCPCGKFYAQPTVTCPHCHQDTQVKKVLLDYFGFGFLFFFAFYTTMLLLFILMLIAGVAAILNQFWQVPAIIRQALDFLFLPVLIAMIVSMFACADEINNGKPRLEHRLDTDDAYFQAKLKKYLSDRMRQAQRATAKSKKTVVQG